MDPSTNEKLVLDLRVYYKPGEGFRELYGCFPRQTDLPKDEWPTIAEFALNVIAKNIWAAGFVRGQKCPLAMENMSAGELAELSDDAKSLLTR